ncbi:MAG: 4-hydroxy-tetrahydrodipicolinate reductase [Methanotrichaceae archaeon]|nr:4-hydroxy-tetrahydrodipicolinate reductase [Methanotrichaceae archaeon]
MIEPIIKVAATGALGRMGTLVIQELSRQEDMKLVAGLDIIGEGKPLIEGVSVMHSSKFRDVLSSIKPDVLIDFTEPNAALQNVLDAADIGIDLVVGTTGFKREQIAQMREAIEGNVAAVISPNFSLGVNVFWKLIALAAQTLKGYDIEVIEAHHNLKKDAPSGTALAALEILKKTLGDVEVVSSRQGIHLRGKEIGVHAIRAGDIVGDHTVLFAGPGERLEIKHQAHSRMAFASGAIKAARWVTSAKPGIYSMSDVLGS